MWRAVTKWAVGAGGLLLAAWGLAAMWQGWDIILTERGWSLFIGGAAALSGGFVTMALGQVLARLDALIALRDPAPVAEAAPAAPAWVAPPPAPEKPTAAPEPAPKAVETAVFKAVEEDLPAEAPPAASKPAEKFDAIGWKFPTEAALAAERPPAPPSAPAAPPADEPVEVDRYVSGDTTYVMFADGSVELQNREGVKRYGSLAELRARASQRNA